MTYIKARLLGARQGTLALGFVPQARARASLSRLCLLLTCNDEQICGFDRRRTAGLTAGSQWVTEHPFLILSCHAMRREGET
jgi:hypothetical protein